MDGVVNIREERGSGEEDHLVPSVNYLGIYIKPTMPLSSGLKRRPTHHHFP